MQNPTEDNRSGRERPSRIGFVLDYIPDSAIISKQVVLTRDSYTDRWLGSLHREGVQVTKYVPWKDAMAVETHKHQFGHRVKLIPVTHRLIPGRPGCAFKANKGTGLLFYNLQVLAFTLNLLREARSDRIQVLHYTNYFSSAFVLSPLLSLRTSVVTWFTGGNVPKSRLGRWSWFFALRPAFSTVKGVMIGNYPERKRTLMWLLKEDRRKIVPFQLLRVDQRVFKPGDRKEARKRLGYAEDSVELLSIMSIIPAPHDDPENRQPFTMLRIFGEALKMRRGPTQTFLTVIGTGPGLESLKALAAELGADGRVRFEGRVEHDKLSSYYAAADLVFVPLRLEALNETNVLGEAFSCGRPGVAFKRSEDYPLMQDGGFLVSSDPTKGVRDLTEILDQPETIARKSAEALSLSGQFNLDTAASDLLAAYATILGK